MKKRIFSLLLALVMAVSLLPVSAFAADDYELRVLTFEDADYKGGTNFANGNDWSQAAVRQRRRWRRLRR